MLEIIHSKTNAARVIDEVNSIDEGGKCGKCHR